MCVTPTFLAVAGRYSLSGNVYFIARDYIKIRSKFSSSYSNNYRESAKKRAPRKTLRLISQLVKCGSFTLTIFPLYKHNDIFIRDRHVTIRSRVVGRCEKKRGGDD